MIFTNGNVKGADVSYYQDYNETPQQIDFSKMVGQGASFVIIRAGQNLWPDPDFKVNWQNAKEAGLPRGAYWFYDARADPLKQADLYASLLADDPPELEAWLDLEENYVGPYVGYVNWRNFLNRFRQILPGVQQGIYTGYYYINGKIPAIAYDYFSQLPLWLAWYTVNPASVLVPPPWAECRYWQWGTPAWGLTWGCESIEIDMNLFNGTKEEFTALYNTGDTMDENFKYLADQIYKGLHEIAEAVVTGGGGGGGGTLPPADDGRTAYVIKENDANPNDMVKVYKSPDTNETNLETVWARNGANSCTVYDRWEDVPGHPVWSGYSAIQKENTYREWSAIDCTRTNKMYGANGKAYAFPAKIRYTDGSTPKVVWIRKADLGL